MASRRHIEEATVAPWVAKTRPLPLSYEARKDLPRSTEVSMAKGDAAFDWKTSYVFPARLGLGGHAGRLLAYRELMLVMVARDLKARYTQSVLGVYWAVINPLVHALVLTVAFSLVVRVEVGETPYFLFILTGLLSWNLLANALPDATNSLVDHENLVTKMPFPREIIPLSAVLARIVDFVCSLLVLIAIMVAYRWSFHPHILAVVPLAGLPGHDGPRPFSGPVPPEPHGWSGGCLSGCAVGRSPAPMDRPRPGRWRYRCRARWRALDVQEAGTPVRRGGVSIEHCGGKGCLEAFQYVARARERLFARAASWTAPAWPSSGLLGVEGRQSVGGARRGLGHCRP